MSSSMNKANLIAVTSLAILLKIGFKSSIFRPVWPWNLMDDLKKKKGTSSTLCETLCIISKSSVNSNWSYSPETHIWGQNWWFFCPVWPWNLTDDLEKNRATSSFVHHFKAICAFKLELQSGSNQFGSKSIIFRPVWPWNLTGDLEKQ